MFFLSLDVTMHPSNHRFTDGKCAVPFLPREGTTFLERSRNPAGGVRFNLADQFRNRLVLAQLRQDMDVVGGSVNNQRNSIFSANCAAEVLVDSRADCLSEPRLTTFGRKDDVIKQIAIGGTHSYRSYLSPLFRGSCVSNNTPGVSLRSTPGFSCAAPVGCSDWHGRSWTARNAVERRSDNGVERGVQRSESLEARAGLHSLGRPRRRGIQPGVERSETPGKSLQKYRQPLTRGGGTDRLQLRPLVLTR
jgi:hypothetical protein